ncbi:MAG TPA: hypothetical protein VGV88_12820 [Candidatus Dormibacteraeota bacterium]|nr:hypothetical protein [Candidatus Dormibacteraeota bacterium]
MNNTYKGTATADEGGGLDPRDAAKLLEQTKRQARRAFDIESPVVAVVGAGVFLFGYGAAWWSLRGQHPEVPALWSLGVLYGLIAISAIVGSVVMSRATAGVSLSAEARRQNLARSIAIGSAAVGAWVVEGALRSLGVNFEIVYGVFGPTVPLIAIAGAAAGAFAMQQSWLQLGAAVGFIAVASLSTFFGPAGAWGLTGLGCCLVLLVYAGALVARERRA